MADTPASDTATLASLNDNKSRRGADQIDIRQAEAEFTQLQRTLSRPPFDDHAHSPEPEHLPKDLEKASDDLVEAEERFDLREYLSSSNDAGQAAGIKHKHVGVTWENLEVTGIGGEDNKASFSSILSLRVSYPRPFLQIYVPTFLDAIMGTVMFPVMLVWGLISPLLPPRFTRTPPTRTIIHK